MNMKKILLSAISFLTVLGVFAQSSSSSSAVIRRSQTADRTARTASGSAVSPRQQARMEMREADDSELQWMKVMYRSLDLTKEANGALYFPDEPVEGQDNLFRIIIKRMSDGQLPAYEYLDGREVFTDDYLVKMGDVLDRFYILHTPAKGSTENNPRYVIDDSDIPASEVLSYYVMEKWEFDRRQNRMRARVEAVCPVLHRAGDFGAEAVKYPMFWVKYSDLRPYLITQQIFTDDYNNLASSTYDDYFQLGLYEGDIYKTRNLRNKSLMQLYPDPDELTHARDSIQQSLDTYEKKLWVPSLEELAARREAAVTDGEGSDTDVAAAGNSRATRSSRGTKKLSDSAKPAKVKKPKATKSTSSSTATRSVRNRRR